MAKYVHFRAACAVHGAWGEVRGDVVDILTATPLKGGKPTGKTLKLSAITEYLPVSEGPNVICIGANYAEHCKESDKSLPDHPLIFLKLTTCLTAHDQPVVLPREAPNEVDYEAELVAIIGKTAKNVSESEALSHVLGYTVGNDISARDCQLKIDAQWARGKAFDTFAPTGPFLVTGIADPQNLSIKFRRNGELLQNSNTKHMIFKLPFLISYLSRQFTLLPGTAIFTGTPDGVGFARKPPVFLREGDVCEAEIEHIGTLRNRVIKEK